MKTAVLAALCLGIIVGLVQELKARPRHQPAVKPEWTCFIETYTHCGPDDLQAGEG